MISPYSSDAGDVLAAMAGEAGFETFEETETGMKGYVQQQLFDEAALKAIIEEFPFMETTVTYEVKEAENKDWNEQWEQEGFDPICIADKLVIHDGRHLPDTPAAVHWSSQIRYPGGESDPHGSRRLRRYSTAQVPA